jgi:predicted NAD-dependent protein-ADP-ribosyltransferase YbiA (DUF1768 family)
MDETLWYKFTQHTDLKEELLSTGDAELVEVRHETKYNRTMLNCTTGF